MINRPTIIRTLLDAQAAGSRRSLDAWAREFGCHPNSVSRIAKSCRAIGAIEWLRRGPLPTPAPSTGTITVTARTDARGRFARISGRMLRRAGLLGECELRYTISANTITLTAGGKP